MRRQVNLRFVALLLLTLIVLGGTAHFLHGFQVKRNARALLHRAQQMEEEKDFGKSLDYLSRYLAFYPRDTEARARYALLLDQQAKTPQARLRAFLALDEVLRQAPDRDDVRRRAISAAMGIERFADAREHLEVLMQATPDDPELEELRGRCEEAGSQFAWAAQWYEKAIQHAPQRIDCCVRLAKVYRRRLDRAQDADKLMDRLVKTYPDSIQARLARAAYLSDLKLLAAANLEIAYVREKLAPDEADVLASSADLAQAMGKPDEARRYFERGQQLHPGDPRFHFGLARLELSTGRRAKALRCLRQALEQLPDQAPVIWMAADLFLDAGEAKEARQLLVRLSHAEWHSAVNYLRARLLLLEGRFAEARTLLEKQRQQLTHTPDLAWRADVFLGVCYERLGNPEQQLAAYRRAASSASSPRPARLGLAAALLANGQLDEALSEYQRLMPEVPETRLIVARLLLLRNMRLPARQRSWGQLETLLRDAPEQVRDSVEYRLLGVELLLGRDKLAEARQELQAACRKAPAEVRYWLALAALADRDQTATRDRSFVRSLEVLDEADKAVGDVVELRLARANRLSPLPAAQVRDALRRFEEKTEHFNQAEQTRLQVGLADASERLGDRENARRLLGQAAAQLPEDLGIRQRLFALALAAEDDAACKATLAEVRKMEGEEGALWRFAEAARLVALAHRGDRSGLAQARRRLTEVARIRSAWSRVPLLSAQIDDLEGNVDTALDSYHRAIEMGEQSPQAVYRTVQLLIARRRIDEAKQILDRMQERVNASADLSRLATEVSWLNQDPRERTLELANQDAVKKSKDFRDQLFRAQVLWSVEKPQEAEAAFRQAVALDPTAPEAWVALVVFLTRTDQKQKAEAEVERAKRALPADQRPLALAACYEALGQRDVAEEQHVALLKSKPDDLSVLRGLASFYLRGGEVKKAEPHLRQMIVSSGRWEEETPRWARRHLAIALASSGDFQQTRQALGLIEENLRERTQTPEDLRIQALVLAMQPGGRRESIRALERSYSRLRPTLGEQLLLAQLFDANHDWPKANEYLLALLNSRGGDAPPYLAYYVRALLRRDKVAEAALWLDRLKKKDPGTAVTLELTARVLAKQGKGEQAARLIVEFVEKEFAARKDPAILAGGAGLLGELNQPADAERLYRKYVTEAEGKNPESVLRLATFLARQHRLPEALDLCEQAGPKCKPESVAVVCVNGLRAGQPREQDFQRVERWLEQVLRQQPESQLLLAAQANLRDAQGRVDDAEAIYRSMLARSPGSLLARNNLAWLLATASGKQREALEMINGAIERGGPLPGLLDTRGTIHLAGGQAEQAVKDLEAAVAEVPKANYYWHLAQAYLAVKNRLAAQQAWHKAQELKLSEKDLHPLEVPAYRELLAELDRK